MSHPLPVTHLKVLPCIRGSFFLKSSLLCRQHTREVHGVESVLVPAAHLLCERGQMGQLLSLSLLICKVEMLTVLPPQMTGAMKEDTPLGPVGASVTLVLGTRSAGGLVSGVAGLRLRLHSVPPCS